ncbi:PAS domain S-box protein [Microvirga tunisiensis]|uniref:histidine kinase n=1 Tax=Microvirga tunisiensis TaxID=2108360 RepID=A0A5N7MWQ6_9HYPH|nr:PAS domain S-box protein [Microvirga tunisiensis]MPR31130.1 PAS domain S-box protein [Microvirga tunisiensis]
MLERSGEVMPGLNHECPKGGIPRPLKCPSYLFGYSEAETDGSWWKDHIHPEDRERVVSGIASVITSDQETWSAEYRFLRADGSEAYVFDRGFVSRDRQGRAVRMIGSMLDLTRRRRDEEALRRSEERLRGAFAIKTVGVLFWGQDFRLTQVNDAFLGMTGFSREEALGKTWQELTPEEFHPASWRAVEEVTTLGEATPYEKQYFRKDGSRWWGLFAPRSIGEEAVEFVLDITDRREAEERLRESEAKFQAIANSIDQMIWSTRPDGYHDFFNQRWYDYTGVPEGSTDGAGWADIFHPDDQERTWATWRHCLATGEPYRIECRLRHRSGQYRWVLGRAQPVRDEQGRITRWFGTCTDIQRSSRPARFWRARARSWSGRSPSARWSVTGSGRTRTSSWACSASTVSDGRSIRPGRGCWATMRRPCSTRP